MTCSKFLFLSIFTEVCVFMCSSKTASQKHPHSGHVLCIRRHNLCCSLSSFFFFFCECVWVFLGFFQPPGRMDEVKTEANTSKTSLASVTAGRFGVRGIIGDPHKGHCPLSIYEQDRMLCVSPYFYHNSFASEAKLMLCVC